MQDINRPQGMFKSMLEHARKDNYIKKSMFKVKESTYAVKLVSDNDAGMFLNELPTWRDKLIFKTMYLTGARIGEVLELQIEDITVEDLEAHRSHLRELEELLERNIYGEHYAAHFTPVIAVLKEIIRRLKEIDDAD